ncbi:NAD(P)H-dependent oxidoreductase [Cognatiyoonia sp. IB215446]|uniref:FMN-dependent NADH-azoreductase n=1 Tax=Cognatiyoonia sp. IB215446 TaxID=3097355 RepID=UPI002A0DED4B|nr:NAD(P)H-dependent oxidoreductase [Cognatiyoonia sp. IB215446]MDX8349113.1 NAD(P)H-dependent oxidoreductase [Cognatiyoonia sp. IB215446]
MSQEQVSGKMRGTHVEINQTGDLAMTRILRIDSSSRPAAPEGSLSEGSFSRAMADHISAQLLASNPDAQVLQRDLMAEPIAHITNDTIKGYYTPPEAMTDTLRNATALSDALIVELREADAIVLSAPIYNFSLPSALKAWIDQIVRIGQTFSYEEGQFAGLLKDRPTYLALSYGATGYGPGGPLESYDFLRPYLTGVLNFIGLMSVEVFAVEGTTAPDATERLNTALAEIDARVPVTQVA